MSAIEYQDERPTLDVADASRHTAQVDAAAAALVLLNEWLEEPALYIQGNVLTRVTRYSGHTRLEPLAKASLIEFLADAAIFLGKDGHYVLPPSRIAEALLNRRPSDLAGKERMARGIGTLSFNGHSLSVDEEEETVSIVESGARKVIAELPTLEAGIPQVERVVDVPVFGEDRGAATTQQRERGYHPGSRTYLDPATEIAGRLDEIPAKLGLSQSSEDILELQAEEEVASLQVRQALDVLRKPFAEFPFASRSDYANFLAMIIEPFVRTTIGTGGEAITPMYAFSATTPGTGKSLLAKCGLYIGCGTVPVAIAHRDQSEFDRSLTATLLAGPSAIVFDNVNERFDHGSLAAALTTGLFRGRIYGTSRVPEVTVRCVWAVTGNNLELSRELTRRTVPIRLEYDGDPLQRSFAIPNLEEYVREHRVDLIAAVHTLVLNWLHGGEPSQVVDLDTGDVTHERRRYSHQNRFLNSYERWTYVLGGILGAAGVNGFLGNLDAWASSVSPDEQEIASLLETMHGLSIEPLTTKEWASRLLGEAQDGGWPGDKAVLPSMLLDQARDSDQLAKGLAYRVFRKYKDHPLGGYRLHQRPGDVNKWSVELVGSG